MANYLLKFLWIGIVIIYFHQVSGSHIHVAEWSFKKTCPFFTVCLFILCLIIVKVIHSKVHWMNSYIPESFILLVIGIIFGLIIRFAVRPIKEIELQPTLFFLILLPPIVLNSAYEMTTRPFFKVFGIVIMFAVLATILNFIIIGFTLHGVVQGGQNVYGSHKLNLSLRTLLLFSSLIVAVDPVAVLAIFNDIGVEHELYFIVFGESLLNDAVTVVLYEIMQRFLGTAPIPARDIGLGISSFFAFSLGGLAIGIAFGVISCLATRLKNEYEVALVLLLAYFSYILADTIKWSGIIAIIGCGMVQAEYTFKNISPESNLVLRKVLGLWSSISEGIIFLFLGEGMAHIERGWHTGFIFWSLFICLVARGVVAWLLTAINNAINVENRKISKTELLILIYGGLRGAVAFSLATLITIDKIDGSTEVEKETNRDLIISTTLFIILFTIGVQGLTMKPLVKLLHIRVQKVEDLSLFKTTNNAVIDTMLPAIEGLVGETGENIVREKIKMFNTRYIRPILQKRVVTFDENIMEVLGKISLAMHYALLKPNKSTNYLLDNLEKLRCNKYSSKNILSTSRLPTELHESTKISVEMEPNLELEKYTTALAQSRRMSLRSIESSMDPGSYLNDFENILKNKRKVIERADSYRRQGADSVQSVAKNPLPAVFYVIEEDYAKNNETHL